MTIENTSTTDTGANSDGFTPAEMAYLSSGGRETEALEKEWSGAGSGEGVAGNSDQSGAQDGQDKTAAGGPENDADDDVSDEELGITIGADGKARDGKGKFVPLSALHAVREKYKATRNKLVETETKFARVDERMAVINELLGKAAAPEGQQPAAKPDDIGEAPDPEKDIFAFVKWQGKMIERLQTKLDEKVQPLEQHRAEQQFRSTYFSDASAFQAQNPDFRDAYVYLVNGRDKELEAVGVKDPAARKAQIAKEERALVENAMQQQLSPSQVLYNFAKARGYTKAAPKADPAKVDPVEKIEQIAKGQKIAGNSFSNAGGVSGEGLTSASIASMSEAEFDAVMSKLTVAQQRALLGG